MLPDAQIPLSSPDIGLEEKRAVAEVLDSQYLSLGPVLNLFEEEFARAVQRKFAIAVNSGTSGLHLCVRAAGLGQGDEVITTPFSFVASANCLLFEGAVPRFVDIDPATYNMDAGQLDAAVNPKTRGVLPVHVFGRPCSMDPVIDFAEKRGLVVIEDACEAIGATYKGRAAGSFGQTGVFAFYPNKQLTTGEGGMVVTDSEEVANLCKSMRNQGRTQQNNRMEHGILGYNYRLPEISCALGRVQLSRLQEILSHRSRVADAYTKLLREEVPEVITPAPPEPGTSISWFVYVVRLHDEFRDGDRDQVIEALQQDGIGANAYFPPIHLQPLYRSQFGYRPGAFPVAERIGARTLAIPFFNRITQQQIERVVQSLANAIASLKHRNSVVLQSSAGSPGR